LSLLSRLAKIAAEKGAEKLAVRKGAKTAERAAEDLAVRPRAPTLAAKPKAPPKPKALPAPKKVLALPKPGPGLPEYAAKPKGGQWWADRPDLGMRTSPENAARALAGGFGLSDAQFVPENSFDGMFTGTNVPGPREQWLRKALTKYFKNDFGTPDDPLRDLAARGLHFDPEMTPESWGRTVNSALMEDPIQHIMFPPNELGGMPGAGDDLRGTAMATMPWLAKQPSTDKVYGIHAGGLDLSHFIDEMDNAFNADVTGIPADLAVRPESLARMSFPQAVERVGRINQWRAKQMEQAALSNLSSPAIHTFKEYTENNPMGLRWVELRKPDVPEGYATPEPRRYRTASGEDRYVLETPDGDEITAKSAEEALRGYYPPELRRHLQDALRYEGDTMGHCVGGYCGDVLSGRRRIFSLRDARGEPHVTIETAPYKAAPDREARYAIEKQAAQEADARRFQTSREWDAFSLKRQAELADAWRAANATGPEDIVQIKGKQNRAPKDDYLPFVQDFVKSQQWGNIGDLGNTGLVKLPDGRYITQAQLDEGLQRRFGEVDDTKRSYFRRYAAEPAEWEQYAPHFQGYAVGGKVDADRCFCHNPLSVRRG